MLVKCWSNSARLDAAKDAGEEAAQDAEREEQQDLRTGGGAGARG